ncbi:MFS transporter, partial [Clostridioides difficile]|uniref:MFS transporter n=1 Tax=Clostridioides difficile TaxID=1496 RepID=UPI00117AE640
GKTEKRKDVDFSDLKRRILGSAGMVLILICVMNLCQTGLQRIRVLYVEDKFGVSTKQVDVIWMVIAGILIVVQGFLTGTLAKKIGEKRLILIGMFCKALVAFAIVLTTGFVSLVVGFGLCAVSLAITLPTLNATLSKTDNQLKR